jgi:hypothetical protein
MSRTERGAGAEPGAVLTGASLALLSMAPHFAAYEWALWRRPDLERNAGERILGLALDPFGDRAAHARWALLALALALAYVRLRAQRARTAEGLARIAIEGMAWAVVIGPLLVLVARLASRWAAPLAVAWDPLAQGGADPVGAALLFGGSAWEELAFRLGAYSLLYWGVLRALGGFGTPSPVARGAAEACGLCGSAVLFAAAHVEPFAAFLGSSGRPADPSLVVWLLLAGLALGLLFRLRGPGIAAWAHGLFNAALWIGVDPQALLAPGLGGDA